MGTDHKHLLDNAVLNSKPDSDRRLRNMEPNLCNWNNKRQLLAVKIKRSIPVLIALYVGCSKMVHNPKEAAPICKSEVNAMPNIIVNRLKLLSHPTLNFN